MNRRPSVFVVLGLLGFVAACGGIAVMPADDTAAASGAGGASGDGAGGGGGACEPPPPPSPTVPDGGGCYVNDMGTGWVAIPCGCELWLENTSPTPVTADVQLAVTPPDQVPSLTGALDVEIAFEDPDASWYATWTQQPGSGEAFVVSNEGGKTNVRMGQSSVALAPVPLAACETRKAAAVVVPGSNFTASLSMHAVLDGAVTTTTDGTCSNPPPQM
jgi:hypothetical protein